MDTLPSVSIAAIVRNDFRRLLEWLSYHDIVGISDFIVYDNDSTDGTYELAHALKRMFQIELIRWPVADYLNAKNLAYEDSVHRLNDQMTYVGFVDVDEFLSVSPGDSLPETLATFGSDVAAIGVNQRVFVSSGSDPFDSDLVIGQFVEHIDEASCEHRLFKTIARPECIDEFTSTRSVRLKTGFYVLSDGSPLIQPYDNPGVAQRNACGLIRVNRYCRCEQYRWDTITRPKVQVPKSSNCHIEFLDKKMNLCGEFGWASNVIAQVKEKICDVVARIEDRGLRSRIADCYSFVNVNYGSVRPREKEAIVQQPEREDGGADNYVQTTKLDFSSAGEKEVAPHLGHGWSFPEAAGRWTVGSESQIILPPYKLKRPIHIRVRLMPMIVTGAVKQQRLEVHFNNAIIGSAILTQALQYVDLAFDVAAEVVHDNARNILTLVHPDGAKPSAHSESTDSRDLSFMISTMEVLDDLSGSFRELGECVSVGSHDQAVALFIVTAVCFPGERPNLDLLRFLYPGICLGRCKAMLWLDCLRAEDFQLFANDISQELKEVRVIPAPRALWGGPSIVQSMLEAIGYGVKFLGDWSQLVFVSMRDVPLRPLDAMLDHLAELRIVDFGGSRWNQQTGDVLFPDNFRLCSQPEAMHYHSFRSDTRLRISENVRDLCPDELLKNGRITHTLPDRYLFSVSENRSTSTLSFHGLTKYRAADRASFFNEFDLIAGRMWVRVSRRFAELSMEDEISDIFFDGFRDIFIADECFFQSVTRYLERRGRITAQWNGYHFDNANSRSIDGSMYSAILREAKAEDLFARKNVGVTSEMFVHQLSSVLR